MKLQRLRKTDYATYGELRDDDGTVVVPAVLEPPTPTVAGKYHYYRYPSPHFGYELFRTDDHGHTAIEMHRGARAKDTHDCQLLGQEFGDVYDANGENPEPGILHSKVMFESFMARMVGIDSFDLEIVDPIE